MSHGRSLRMFETLYRDGSRTVVETDGTQKQMWVYKPGNDTNDADGTVWTNRHSDGKIWYKTTPTAETRIKTVVTSMGETKNTYFNDLRKLILRS